VASHEVALTNIERAIEIVPKDLELAYKLSLIAHEASGRRKKRLESIETAREIRQRLVEASPDNAERKRALSWAEFWLGNYYLDQNQLQVAFKHINACMKLRLELARSNPGDLVARYDPPEKQRGRPFERPHIA
jgi:tetratricopeptide (TPR) repeat protein